jgi:hypothetical protein
MRDPNYIPQPTRHRSGQAVVRLNGRDIYLGRFGTPAVKSKYEKLIASWLANDRQLPNAQRTINEIILAYLEHAGAYYKPIRKRNGDAGRSGEVGCIVYALDVVAELFGRTPTIDFGPKCLKAVRAKMLEKGWARGYANHQVNRVRRMFRWATEEELIDPVIHHALQTVRGLRKGLPGVRESKRIRPAPMASIKAVLPLVPPMVKAMILFQYWTGCRPSEVCRLPATSGTLPTTPDSASLGCFRRCFALASAAASSRSVDIAVLSFDGAIPGLLVFRHPESSKARAAGPVPI